MKQHRGPLSPHPPSMTVRLGFPFWLRPFVVDGVLGITLGDRVYLDPSVTQLDTARIIGILRHEVVHVNQYRRHGVVAFLARYAYEYLHNRLKGMSSSEAYREISFEKEAFAGEQMTERAETNA